MRETALCAERTPENAAFGTRLPVLVVAPSIDILGGQAVQAARLLQDLRGEECVEIAFQATNPRPAARLKGVRKIKYLRTVFTFVQFLWEFVAKLRAADCVHVFSPSYFAFLLAPAPVIVLSRLFRRR